MSVFELWQVVRHYPVARIVRRIRYLLKRRVLARLAARWPAWDRRYAPRGEVHLNAQLPRTSGRRRCFEVQETKQVLTVRLLGETIDLSAGVDWEGAQDALRNSHLRRYHLHYMEYLGAVSDEAFERLTLAWIASNRPHLGPPTDGFASYCISIRVVVWLDELDRRRERLSASTIASLVASLAEQVNFLHDFVETDLGGNHLFRNLRTLLWASAWLDCADAARWRRRALGLLPGELRHQFLPDGFHFERSPAYHAQMMLDLADIIALDDPGVDHSAARAVYACAQKAYVCSRHPDGGVARFNDGLFGECEAMPPIDVGSPEDGVSHFEDAGYLFWRSQDDFLALDIGGMEPDDLPGHAHADVFAFEWSLGGRRMIVDPGVFAYEAGDARHYARCTAAHSTVCVEGQSQANLHGSFRVGRTPQVSVRQLVRDQHGFDVEASHDGFMARFGVAHVRKLAVRRDRVLLEDRIDGDAPVGATGSLLCHPLCQVTAQSPTRCLLKVGDVTVTLESSEPVTIRDDDYFESMGQRQKTCRICYPVTQHGTTVTFDIARGLQE